MVSKPHYPTRQRFTRLGRADKVLCWDLTRSVPGGPAPDTYTYARVFYVFSLAHALHLGVICVFEITSNNIRETVWSGWFTSIRYETGVFLAWNIFRDKNFLDRARC